jgi:hypothetical protein
MSPVNLQHGFGFDVPTTNCGYEEYSLQGGKIMWKVLIKKRLPKT